MKHLLILILILISLLLLSSPVIGEGTLPVSGGKGVTLYEWKTSSGSVYQYFGDKKIHPRYEGEVENGVPHGLGVLSYPNTSYYVGEWKNGFVWNVEFYNIFCLQGSCWIHKSPNTIWRNGKQTNYDKDGNIVE